VVKRVERDYIQPAVFGDLINISTKLISIKNASLVIEQNIYNDDIHLFKAKITLAYLKDKKPAKIPKEFKELFEELK